MLFSVFIAIHVVVALALVGVVLLQQGKGADMGAAFGSGASGTVFGSQGARSFLSKITTYLGGAFFITSLALAMLAGGGSGSSDSVLDRVATEQPAAEQTASDELTPAGEEAEPAPADQESITPAPAPTDDN